MKIDFGKKSELVIIASISIILLLELFLAYKITLEYLGVYSFSRFSLFILIQPVYFCLLFKGKRRHKGLYYLGIGLVILLPILFYFTLPQCTYNEGKQYVILYLQSNEDTSFVDISEDKDTVSVIDDSKRLFVYDRFYYYITIRDDMYQYFAVNPDNGEVIELLEDFWEDF